MFHHQLLSDVEHTLNILEFCVLLDFRIRCIIRPKMDGGFHRRSHEHSPYQNICFVCLHWEGCVGCGHSQLLVQTLKVPAHVLMVRVFRVSQFWVMTQQVSLSWWSLNILSRHFLFGFDPPAPVSWMLAEHSLVDSLENFRLLILKRIAPVSWMLFRLLFFHRYSPDWPEIPNFVKRFPHSFARAPPDMVSLSPLESLRSKSSSNLFLTWRSAF